MIATSFKDHLSRALSYPLGAEAISAALSDAPHLDDIELSFHADGGLSRLEFQRVLSSRQPYSVCCAEYRPARKPSIGIDPRYSVPRWSLVVYPVLSELRHPASQLLRAAGLPALRNWLAQSSDPGWLAVPQQLDIVLSPTEMTVETRNTSGV